MYTVYSTHGFPQVVCEFGLCCFLPDLHGRILGGGRGLGGRSTLHASGSGEVRHLQWMAGMCDYIAYACRKGWEAHYVTETWYHFDLCPCSRPRDRLARRTVTLQASTRTSKPRTLAGSRGSWELMRRLDMAGRGMRNKEVGGTWWSKTKKGWETLGNLQKTIGGFRLCLCAHILHTLAFIPSETTSRLSSLLLQLLW